MKEDLSTILPQELWINILGRLPIRSVMRCKFVCKSWGDLIEGGDFLTSYIPKPCLAFGHEDTGYAVCDDACEPLFRFRLAQSGLTPSSICAVHDSVNGLLLVKDIDHYEEYFFCLVNPMTREYIKLSDLSIHSYIFGFGVSKLSGQYKILLGDQWRPRHIYTLGGGEGLLRSIAEEIEPPRQSCDGDAKFLNGNLHWLASGSNLVCCFDLETELFTTFSHPIQDYHGDWSRECCAYEIFILEDLLCLCHVSDDVHVFIWMMNNYGDAKSWVKKYTFDQQPYILNNVLPLKVLENGDLFTSNTDDRLFIYSQNTKAVETFGLLQRAIYLYFSNITIYTPTFLSLKSMGIHNVGSSYFY